MNVTIYHNPRCSKSRCGLEYLKGKGIEPTIVDYINAPLDEQKIHDLLRKMGKRPIDIVRQQEEAFASYKGKSISDNELVTLMVNNPKLIERPIVETETKAVIARPTEEIDILLANK